MGLKEYQRKRKFSKTPEPQGKEKKGKGELRFVIQMHAATRLHYDFRLELDGVLKSWAVPKGPSLNPSDQRLAVEVEDHPMDYGDFEGTIPDGNYGAGAVLVWDNGTYHERTSSSRAESEKRLREGLKKGHITFILEGKKLQGEFALVRLKDAKSWLLVKKRDSFSSYKAPPLDDSSVKSGRTIEEVREHADAEGVHWKSRRVGKKSPPKSPAPMTRPKTLPPKLEKPAGMPRRLRPMLPVAMQVPEEKGWIYDKFGSGVRAIVELEDGNVSMHSRFLLPIATKYPTLQSAFEKLEHNLILDGEIIDGTTQRFHAIDLLYLDGKDLRELPLSQRIKELEKLKLKAPIEVAKSSATAPEPPFIARLSDSKYQSGTSRDWIKSSLRAGKNGASAKAGDGPALTNLDKIFFPKQKITKGDVVEYYRTVSPFILPHLKDRPQSMHRHPNGIDEQGFFQKDLTGHVPKFIKTERVYSESSEKTINYALVQNESSLLYLANLGCIELNVWLSRVPHLDKPDYCVIDLDPDENPFTQVIEVAQETHKLLSQLKVPHGCKTSGASGIHIYIPLSGETDYDFTKNAALAIVEKIHEKMPDITSLERTPARRRGKIYLDFLQNRRSQTMAAPYCIRPHAGAPVSTPIEWKELTKKLRPEQFTIETVPKRLKKIGDPWSSLLSEGITQSLLKKRLAGLK